MLGLYLFPSLAGAAEVASSPARCAGVVRVLINCLSTQLTS